MIYFLNLGRVFGGQENSLLQYSRNSPHIDHKIIFYNCLPVENSNNVIKSKFPVFLLVSLIIKRRLCMKQSNINVVLVGNRAAYLSFFFRWLCTISLYLHTELEMGSPFRRHVREWILVKSIECSKHAFHVGSSFASLKYKYNIYNLIEVNPDVNIETAAVVCRSTRKIMKFLYCGAFTHHKGAHVLIKAFGKLGTDYHLTVVGKVDEKLLSGTNLKNISFVGFEDDDIKKFEYYEACDAYISLSFYESFGISLFDALRMAKPIVCSNVSGHRKVLGSDYKYFVDKNFDYTNVVDMIKKLNDAAISGSLSVYMQRVREAQVTKIREKMFSSAFNAIVLCDLNDTFIER